MKRTIKFKFWLGHTKKMTYGHTLKTFFKTGWEFTDDIIPLQFTGIHDKNGTEIYEGDIMKYKEILVRVEFYSIFSGFHIKWQDKEGINRFDLLGSNMGDDTGYLENDRFELIGNIYENPELLNK